MIMSNRIAGPRMGPEGEVMVCPVCKRLERTLEGWNTECVRARSSLYCTVSNRFEAYDVVEMERARSELQMHRAGCAIAIAKPPAPPVSSKTIVRVSVPRLASRAVASSRQA
jgi:hypothetical protein